ncbi:tyrosine-type recombinase/integrase [Pseudorhodoferax sp. LjRoot39]|uniref:tyrosine-type recombinase/integrase n=1 Tax=Pseudorhodoferax sp. LjRoot39 TaxID=3342328 RepID=UPI003ECC6521
MRLLSSTADLVISGVPYEGLPILLWDNMERCAEANEFLRSYLLRGSIGSSKSWEPTGRALYDFFSFLQAHELQWTDVDRGEEKTLLAAYRDYSLNTAGLGRTTVRTRLRYLCAFYAFAQQRGWIAQLPFAYEARQAMRSGSYLAHVDATGGRSDGPDVLPRVQKTLPKYLTLSEIASLLSAAANPHHRMMLRLALGSGLRKHELATFPRAYVFDPDLAGNRKRNIAIDLDPGDGNGMQTKGSNSRRILIGRRLMRDLNHYAVHLRGMRSSLSSTPQKALFLNQAGEPFAADGKSLDRIVRDIGAKAGLRAWTHLLRHTYATQMLSSLQRSRDQHRMEPLVFLQHQLGHASIETTMKYLHVVKELADEAVLSYDDELNNLADGLDG